MRQSRRKPTFSEFTARYVPVVTNIGLDCFESSAKHACGLVLGVSVTLFGDGQAFIRVIDNQLTVYEFADERKIGGGTADPAATLNNYTLSGFRY